MKRFWILTFVDLVCVGNNVKSVRMFQTEEECYEVMKKEYLEKAIEDEIDNPFADDSYGYELSEGFAYIADKYYWDIFNEDLNM